MQTNLYRFCRILPAEAWTVTPAEAEFRIVIDRENIEDEHKFQQYIEARLCAVIMNANGARKEDDDSPFTVEDFLPKNIENIPLELQEELDELKARRTAKALSKKCTMTI